MKLAHRVWVAAPAAAVWRHVEDPSQYLHFMDGITRWEVDGRRRKGLGARYRVLMHVGSAEIGGLIEVVEYVPQRELAWTSVVGIDQRGRWRLRPDDHNPDRTSIELRMSATVPGGLYGRVADLIARPVISRHIRRTLRELRRQVEHERERATARRRHRGR